MYHAFLPESFIRFDDSPWNECLLSHKTVQAFYIRRTEHTYRDSRIDFQVLRCRLQLVSSAGIGISACNAAMISKTLPDADVDLSGVERGIHGEFSVCAENVASCIISRSARFFHVDRFKRAETNKKEMHDGRVSDCSYRTLTTFTINEYSHRSFLAL